MKIKNDKLFIQIACLICSVILWVIVMIQTNPIYETNITNIPVKIKNLQAIESSNLVLMNTDKDNLTVSVKVKGYSDQLQKISKSDFSAYIDVLGFGEGTKYAKVDIIGPNGVEIQEPFPAQIPCVIESVISRVMDVTVQYAGNQAKEYYRGEGVSNPTSVKITGPRSIVDSAKTAVATINVDGAKDTVLKTVPVRIYSGTDTEILMTVPIDNVKVTVPIFPTKYVPITPKIIGEPLEGYKLVNFTVKPEKVKIAAKKDILDSIKELHIAELDITGEYHNILSSKEILDDRDIILLDLNTLPVVNAVIEKIIQKEISYISDNIEFTNIKEGYDVKLVNKDEIITATISGAESIINQFIKDDLKLTVNLEGAIPGVNHVKIEGLTGKNPDSIKFSKDIIDVELIESDSTTAE